MTAAKAEAKITPKTRAIVAANTNGHPADWTALRELATKQGLPLIEDSTEAIGSKYKDALVGTFGDAAVFDFSQPSPLVCGEGRHDRHRRRETRRWRSSAAAPMRPKNAPRFR